jgi:hypothetical protein
LRLPIKLVSLFHRRNRQRQPKEVDQAETPDEEKVTKAMARKIIDDARRHRLLVEEEEGKGGQSKSHQA